MILLSSVLLCNNFPSVNDQSHFSPILEAAMWLIWLVDDTRGITYTITQYLFFFYFYSNYDQISGIICGWKNS